MNTPAWDLESNFTCCYESICMWTKHPKVLRWSTQGHDLVNASYKVWKSSALVGDRLRRQMAVATTSAQYASGNFFACIIVLAISVTVLFLPLVTPFCWGVLGTVSWWRRPVVLQNDLNSCKVNLPPRSVHKAFTNHENWASIICLNCLNSWKTSDFLCIKYFQEYLEQLSMNNRKYELPLMEVVFTGPTTLACTW